MKLLEKTHTTQNPELKANFQEYIVGVVNKYLLLYTGLIVFAVSYYSYSDIFIRENIQAFYTRLFTLLLSVILLIFHLLTKEKHQRIKYYLYNILLFSALIMMYAKYLVYIKYEGSAFSVTGIILVVFLITVDLKANLIDTILIYFFPTLLFAFILLFFVEIPKTKVVNMGNVYPMIILGFAVNRVQYNLRFRLFKSNYLLEKEKQRTKKLYKETVEINEKLRQRNKEILLQHKSIEAKNEELLKLNDNKDKFFSIISHDLKTPFSAMLGFSDLLNENFDNYDDIRKKKYLSHINQSIHRTYKLLENLLLWAQVQGDKDEVNFKPEKIFLLVEEIVDQLRQAAIYKNTSLVNLVDIKLVAKIDKMMIKTVFRNLISNAIKFSPKGGTIVIKSSLTADNDLRYVNITVEDAGIGISEERQKRLFDVSQRLSTQGTNNETGTGLGLILCKNFIEKHNGKIWVESKENVGSRFIFSLPLST